jgi:hypothetical protein
MQNDWIPGWATGWLWLTCTAAFVGICGTAAAAPRLVLLWRHDGALLVGGKQDMAQDHVDLCRTEAKPTPGPAKPEPGR